MKFSSLYIIQKTFFSSTFHILLFLNHPCSIHSWSLDIFPFLYLSREGSVVEFLVYTVFDPLLTFYRVPHSFSKTLEAVLPVRSAPFYKEKTQEVGWETESSQSTILVNNSGQLFHDELLRVRLFCLTIFL